MHALYSSPWPRFLQVSRLVLGLVSMILVFQLPAHGQGKEPLVKNSTFYRAICEALAGSSWSREPDFMSKRLALLAIRLFVSVNLLYAAILFKFAGVPDSVVLFTQMSQAVHGLVSQPVFRLGSGVFETMVAVLLLIPETARLGAGLAVMWMTAVILSHIFVLGYGWFFVDALMVMVLAVIYLLLTRWHSHRGESESVATMAALQTHKKIVGRTVGSGATRS